MNTQKVFLSEGVWTEISSTSISVSHKVGGLVLYVVSSDEPPEISDDDPIMTSTTKSNEVIFDGIEAPVWALAINEASELDVTQLSTSSSTVNRYDGFPLPVSTSLALTKAELYTALGRRFAHKFDLTFSGSETKYFLYKMPDVGADFILSTQERNFKSLNESAELEVLPSATGYTATTQVTNIQYANSIPGYVVQASIYNLTDGDSNVDPTADGDIFDTDFVAGSGSGSNSMGGFSPQIGSRLYPAGTSIVVKVTNLDNSSNRISLEYSWIELPLDYLD